MRDFLQSEAQNAVNPNGLTSILTRLCGKSTCEKQVRIYSRLPNVKELIKIKKARKTEGKKFFISAVITICVLFALFGTAKAYENIRITGFGEYKKAVSFENGKLRILDFEFEII